MSKHQRINEDIKIIAVSPPATLNSTPRVTAAVDLSRFSKVLAILSLGDMAAEAIDFRLETTPTDFTNGVITTRLSSTQLPAHATNNDNKQVVLELDTSQVNGDQWLRARAVTSGTTGGVAEMILIGLPYYSTQPFAASVVEVKNA